MADGQQAEGWYLDPYDRHEQRWFSVGRPTSLVRDARTEGHDPPPDEPVTKQPEPAPEIEIPAGSGIDAEYVEEEAYRASFGNIGMEP